MHTLELGEMELRFAEIIWKHAPISSGELVKRCETELAWKKSTTYTMLRRLIDRGIFENTDSIVRTVMTRAEFDARRSEQFVFEQFGGSLPAFLTAFTSRKKLSDKEVEELRRIIEEGK
ncbi:MAG: BlaI/MecI/CopY family transcriptional regulator [Clostridia bacterium]|nr:BlaI/MecI/CopY family transcriptional regulator [Clostridia bacterium]